MLGGQIAYTYQVDNYPGFPQGSTGPGLIDLFKRHAERFGAEFLEGDATAVDFSSHPFMVRVGGERHEGKAVIIATGSLNRRLGLDSEERLMGRGVFFCTTCDAALYEGKRVAVVGGGDSALQEALDLAKFAREVVILHRHDKPAACTCLKRRVDEKDNIRFLYNTVVEDILGEDRVQGVKVRNTETGEERVLETDGVLIAIGWAPNTSLFRGQVDLDDGGYVLSDGVKTSVEGVYAAGDLVDTKYRQVVTACGSGCMAAIEAGRYIDGLRSGAEKRPISASSTAAV